MNSTDTVSSTIAKNGAAMDRGIDQASATAHESIDKVASTARPAVQRFTATAHQAVEKMMSVANATADTVSQKSVQLMDLQERLVDDARLYVRQKPVTAVAVAVGIGYVLSRILGSKRN